MQKKEDIASALLKERLV